MSEGAPVPSPPPIPSTRLANGILVKALLIGALGLALMIPLRLVRDTLSERQSRREEAVGEIHRSWGAEQVIAGPVLVVPYTYEVIETINQGVGAQKETVQKKRTVKARLFCTPSRLSVAGSLSPQTLYRGIYKTAVYGATMQFEGVFERPDLVSLSIVPESVRWEEAEVTVAVTDLRGTKDLLVFESGDARVPFQPGCLLPGADSGIRARVGAMAAAPSPWNFRFALTFNGSRRLAVVPVGSVTTARLDSTWPDPSFTGSFLPVERTIGPMGFTAAWQVTQYGRSFPPAWATGEESGRGVTLSQMAGSCFGVNLLTVVDAYRTVERSIKYGVLFIVLVFAAFFLFEVLASLRIHPLQYLLVGAALCLFFLGLLSLSEFVPFGRAYAAAAAAATGLITGYSIKLLRSGRRTRLLAALLAVTYGVIFVALGLQDYSLLFGTAILFAALGSVMYATRNVDWYSVGRQP